MSNSNFKVINNPVDNSMLEACRLELVARRSNFANLRRAPGEVLVWIQGRVSVSPGPGSSGLAHYVSIVYEKDESQHQATASKWVHATSGLLHPLGYILNPT